MIWHKLFGRTRLTNLKARDGDRSLGSTAAAGFPLQLVELEDRVLLSATPMAPDAMPDADLDQPLQIDDAPADAAQALMAPTGDAVADTGAEPLSEQALLVEATPEIDEVRHERHELVFVDTSVDGYQDLLDELTSRQDDADILEIVLLDSNADGIEQIGRALEQYNRLDAIHIVSHGSDGAVQLGNVWLDTDVMNAYAGAIAEWGNALTSDADVLFYGCDLAATSDGQSMIDGLAALTGADVAASVDATGHADLGGDWELEYSRGDIQTTELLSPDAQQRWEHLLDIETLYDGFESHSYSGGTGTQSWGSDWQEVGESDGEDNGTVRIVHDDLDTLGSHCLEIDATDGRGIYRQADLGSAVTATLRFDYQRHDIDDFLGSSLLVQVKGNVASDFQTVHTIGPGTDNNIYGAMINLTDYAANDTQIRFIVSGSGSGSIYIDHVWIQYDATPLPNSAPAITTGGGPLTLTTIAEDNANSTGDTVANILASGGDDRITDANSADLEGIAVIDVDDSNGVWQYDADADGNWKDFDSVTNNSAVLLGANSKIRFVPNPDYNGSGGRIEFRAWDQTSHSVGDTGVRASDTGGAEAFSDATDAASITVSAVNDAPQLTLPAAQTVDEDTELALGGISISDVDAGSGNLAVTLSVGNGTLTLGDATGLAFSTGDGTDDPTLAFSGSLTDINAALATLKYQGNQRYNGADQLSINVNDLNNTGTGGALSDGGTVDIDVQGANDGPTTVGISDFSVEEDTFSSRVDLWAAFDDAEQPDDTLRYTVVGVSDPTLLKGAHIDSATGTLVLRYVADENGATTITVRAEDADGLFVDESFTVTITPVNDAPVAVPNFYSVHGDEVLTVRDPGILGNDYDVDGDKLSAFLLRGPRHGKLIMTVDGTFRYIPDPSFVGVDTFMYIATDGKAASRSVRVFIEVQAPVSPVDPGSDTGNGGDSPGNDPAPTDIDPSVKLSTLVDAELPDTLRTESNSSLSGLHDHKSHGGNSGLDSDNISDVSNNGGLMTESGSALGYRLTSRDRYSEDIFDATQLQVSVAPGADSTTLDFNTITMWVEPEADVEATRMDGVLDLIPDMGKAASTAFWVGCILWTLRHGYLLTSLIAQMPAWRFVDPLPILNSLDGASLATDGESLQSIVQSGSEIASEANQEA